MVLTPVTFFFATRLNLLWWHHNPFVIAKVLTIVGVFPSLYFAVILLTFASIRITLVRASFIPAFILLRISNWCHLQNLLTLHLSSKRDAYFEHSPYQSLARSDLDILVVVLDEVCVGAEAYVGADSTNSPSLFLLRHLNAIAPRLVMSRELPEPITPTNSY